MLRTAERNGAEVHSARVPRPELEVHLSDEEIVRRVIAGDRHDYEILMRRYNQRLYRIVRSILRSDAEVEDTLQETYLAAYRHLEQFKGRSRFSTWLTRIAVHEATARARRRRPRRWADFSASDESSLGELGVDETTPVDCLTNRELQAILTRALERLPKLMRVVCVMRDVEGLSISETAECLGISRGNVKVRLHRARLAIGVLIDEEIGSEARRLYQFGGQRCNRVVQGVLGAIGRASEDVFSIQRREANRGDMN